MYQYKTTSKTDLRRSNLLTK